MSEENPLEELKAECFQNPHCTIGYMSATRRTVHKAKDLKALFNHAKVKPPEELEKLDDKSEFEITRNKLANLVYQASRQNGESRTKSAYLWCKTRF